MTSSTAPHAVDSRLSALEARVEGIVGTLDKVVSAVSGLGEKLDKKGQTPWAVIWSALSVMLAFIVAIGGLAYWPIKDGQADIKASLLLMQERADKRFETIGANLVTRAEHEMHWRLQERLYDFQRDRIGRIEGRLDKRLERLEGPFFRPPG